MAIALSINCNTLADNERNVTAVEQTLMDRVNTTVLYFIRNRAKNHLLGNISLSFRNVNGESLLHCLDLMGIYVSTGSACDSVNTQVSHILQAIKTDNNYAKGTIRIHLGKNNTIEGAEMIADSLAQILTK